MYNGYLSGCTVFLDMNGDGQPDAGEPSATTSPFGRFGLTVLETLDSSAMHVVVEPGTDCMDTSTGLPLAIKMKVAAPCGAKLNAVGMVNLITVVLTKVNSTDATATISTGLDLVGFEACSYDPLAYAWATTPSPAEQTTFENFIQVNLEVTTVVKALSDVTGYANDEAYASASDAVLEGIADDFEHFETTGTAGVITFSTQETTKELAEGAATAANTDGVLSDVLLTNVANATASLMDIITEQVDTTIEDLKAGQADGDFVGIAAALENLAKASAVSQNATTEAATLLEANAVPALATTLVLGVGATTTLGTEEDLILNVKDYFVKKLFPNANVADKRALVDVKLTKKAARRRLQALEAGAQYEADVTVRAESEDEASTFASTLANAFTEGESPGEELADVTVETVVQQPTATTVITDVSTIEQSLEANTAKDVILTEIAEADVPPAVQAPSPSPPPSPMFPPPPSPMFPPPPPPTLPPPPSPMFPPPPPPTLRPLGSDESNVASEEADVSLLALLLLLIPLCPILFIVYVFNRYPGRERLYLKWRFSHTNPFFVSGYMPKERRDALWAEVNKKSGTEPPSGGPGVHLTASASEKVLYASKSSSQVELQVNTTASAPGPSSAPSSADVVRDRVDRASAKVDKQFRV